MGASHTYQILYVSYDEENACRVLLKITYDDSRFRLERIASLPDEGAVWIRLCVDHADGRFLYSTDGETFLPAGDPFDASKLSDEYNRPLGFTGPYVGIDCQDFSDWQKDRRFQVFPVYGKGNGIKPNTRIRRPRKGRTDAGVFRLR